MTRSTRGGGGGGGGRNEPADELGKFYTRNYNILREIQHGVNVNNNIIL